MMRFLMEHGCDPNTAMGEGPRSTHAYTIGVCALMQKHTPYMDVLRMLLEYGWDVRGKDRSKTLVAAAENGQVDALRLMVENGADIEAVEISQ